MKIEKLTENKIRVIINSKDLDESNTDALSFMTKSFESQSLFFDILSKAEKEVGFYTEGCQLLIEAFSSADEFLVFTITKLEKKENISNANSAKKKLTVKRKSVNFSNKQAVYSFENFEQFCEFCTYIHHLNNNLDVSKVSKSISLYLYESIYYLVIENINIEYPYLKRFYSALSEFATLSSYSSSFKNKLVEHSKVIMKKHAITTGIKFFT